MRSINDHSDVTHLLFFSCCWKTAVAHHTPQGVQRGCFHQVFFNCVHLCLSWFLLLQAFARSSQDLSSWQEIQKQVDLNELFAHHLPACSPLLHIFPSHSSLACTREQEAPRGAMSLHLFPSTWSMRADLQQDQAFLNISSWQFAWKKTSLHDFSGFHQTLAKIHRNLQLLLLSKL